MLLLRSDELASACATLCHASSCVLDTGTKAAAAAQAGLGRLVTDPFNSHEQYAAIDIDVTAIAGSDLAAKLPGSWLPLAKNTPLFENAIRQRGYLVRYPGNLRVAESHTNLSLAAHHHGSDSPAVLTSALLVPSCR